jgi:hypothetical protein
MKKKQNDIKYEVKFVGQVIKKPLAAGSKSDFPAVKLITKDEELVLRRRGGDPFHDEVLDTLVGKTIQCRGYRKGIYLFLKDWKVA